MALDSTARRRALERQIARLDRRMASLRRDSERLSSWRLALAIGVLAAAVAGLVLAGPPGFFGLGALAVIAFLIAVMAHGRVERAIRRFVLWRAIRQTHLARMSLDWARLPPPLDVPAEPGHPFEFDLDITGERSVHRLLDTCITHEGSDRLRRWLLYPLADPGAIRARADAVRELAARPTFRDQLALQARLASGYDAGRWQGDRLASWIAHHPPPPRVRGRLAVLGLMAGLNIVLFLLNAGGILPPLWGLTWVAYFGLFLHTARLVGEDLFEGALAVQDVLTRLGRVFRFLERARYDGAPHLAALCAPFRDPAERPSLYVRRAARLIPALSIQNNPLLWVMLNAVVPWDIFFALRLADYRAALDRRLPGWLDALYELEARAALAAFAWLNPTARFPDILPAGEARYEARGLGHPLILAERRVTNDVHFAQRGQIMLITGSNMSGKSSFLRALGVNVALACAGSAVCAESLRLGPFRLYTSIRVSDSVTEGFSYFYAEVRRLRGLLDALRVDDALPLFFLIDEIFRGTNNRERLLGSRAYIRALSGQNGVGAIATHDLELVKLADALPGLENWHFRDDVSDGRMHFDYRLRPGPSPTTNALKIMALEGLPVRAEAEDERPSGG
ncbi:MAG: hypothetical protein IT323_22510 [Anaerolineae bacterium]|nr:hypothetical protein [Anaerolineae bacterium]